MKNIIKSLLVMIFMLPLGSIKPCNIPGRPAGMLYKSDYEQKINVFIIKQNATNPQSLLHIENIALKFYQAQFFARQKQYNKAHTIFLADEFRPSIKAYKKLISELIKTDKFRNSMKIEFKCHDIFLKLMRRLKKRDSRTKNLASL